MTSIKTLTSVTPLIVKEGYQTIKKRLFTGDLFFEVTAGGSKIILNKMSVEKIIEVGQKEKINDKIKKTK